MTAVQDATLTPSTETSYVVLVPVPGHPGIFATEDGHLYSARPRGRSFGWHGIRLLVEEPTADGYLRTRIAMPGGQRRVREVSVASLVTAAFYGPRPPGMQVRHPSTATARTTTR